MEANELQLGNWVKYKPESATDEKSESYYRVINKEEITVTLKSDDGKIIRDLEYTDLLPIPLEPKMLFRNGFTQSSSHSEKAPCAVFDSEDGRFSLVRWRFSMAFVLESREFPWKPDNTFYTVHELQNIYLQEADAELHFKL